MRSNAVFVPFSRHSRVEKEYDVAIVGGGIVGVATARELIRRHPKLKFAIIEKENKLGEMCFQLAC